MDSILTDPLGRSVTLHDRTWYGHIVKAHPDMAARREQVEQAIRVPAAIHLSASSPRARLYYAPPSTSGRMICVVADVEGGFVKTAYSAARIKPGDREWPPLKLSKA